MKIDHIGLYSTYIDSPLTTHIFVSVSLSWEKADGEEVAEEEDVTLPPSSSSDSGSGNGSTGSGSTIVRRHTTLQ